MILLRNECKLTENKDNGIINTERQSNKNSTRQISRNKPRRRERVSLVPFIRWRPATTHHFSNKLRTINLRSAMLGVFFNSLRNSFYSAASVLKRK